MAASNRSIKRRVWRRPGPIGKRCKGFPCEGCIICAAWLCRDTTGRFPYTFNEAHEWIPRIPPETRSMK